MSERPHSKSQTETETELWNAIAYFEKILEALPNDRLSLETLANAYEKVGDHTRAQDYTLRLAHTLLDEADDDGIGDLINKIRQFDQSEPEVQNILARLESLQPKKVRALVRDEANATSRRSANIAGEISMAWNLLQAGKLSQEDYARVVHDLSEHSARNLDAPVSTLHVLQDRHHPGFNDILLFVALACNLPIIALDRFDIQPETAALLPLEFVVKRGALIFERMGPDALAAVLNPYDTQLTQDLEDVTGCVCHRYLVAPSDFDATLETLKKLQPAAPPA